MKTKEEILAWLDKQPWKGEFYENCFRLGTGKIIFDKDLMSCAFIWKQTKQDVDFWKEKELEYYKWYNSDNKPPMSWEEYCKTTSNS